MWQMGLIIFFIGFCFLCLWRSQLLMSLISLEFIALGLFLLLFVFVGSMKQPLSIALYFMVLAVCEASLGLSLLVQMIRFKGEDLMSVNNSF